MLHAANTIPITVTDTSSGVQIRGTSLLEYLSVNRTAYNISRNYM